MNIIHSRVQSLAKTQLRSTILSRHAMGELQDYGYFLELNVYMDPMMCVNIHRMETKFEGRLVVPAGLESEKAIQIMVPIRQENGPLLIIASLYGILRSGLDNERPLQAVHKLHACNKSSHASFLSLDG